MGISEQIIKARSGRYKDTKENRRLHRVGQQYGEKKAPETEMDSKNLSKYDTKTLKNASKAMADKIREMRGTLIRLKMGDMQGDKSSIETVQAKIDSAMNGLVAVNLELAERGAIEATGAFETEEEEEKLKEKMKKKLDELPIGTVISHDGHFLEKIEDKLGVEWWKVVESVDPEVVGEGFESREVSDEIASSEDGDFIIESLPTDYLKKMDKKHEATKKKAEKQGRVYLGEAPNSFKVNLAKYLSAKAKENIDRILGQVIPTKSRAELITMYDDTVKNFNEGFDDMKKAARANMLYQILTIKAALDGKQGDKAEIPLANEMSKEEFAEYLASEKGAARNREMNAKIEEIRSEAVDQLHHFESEAVKSFSKMGVTQASIGDGTMTLYFGADAGHIRLYGPSKWHPTQDYMVSVASAGAVGPDWDAAKPYIAVGKFLSEPKLKKEALAFMASYDTMNARHDEKLHTLLSQYPDFSSDGSGVRIE